MKIIYSTLLAFTLIMSAGCKKQLYKDPIGLITEEQVSAEPTLNVMSSSVDKSYRMLSSTLNLIGEWNWGGGTVIRPDIILQDLPSGDVQKKWNPDGDQPWMDDIAAFRFTSDNGGMNGIWSFDYEGIAKTNLALSYLVDDALTSKVGLDPALRNRFLGELYFLRAYYYFDLVNNFGDVPIVLKPIKNFNDAYEVANRVPKAKVWEQISADLALAKAALPSTKFSSSAEKWRVSKGAVIALQAKVALYNEKWADVITLVTELETLNFYNLNANYFDSFSVAKEFTDNEVIFAFDHRSGQVVKTGNGLCALLDWGFFAPTTSFLNAFEPNDPRLEYTVSVGPKNVNKLLGSIDGTNKGNDDSPSNKILIRMADVLLWKAEAYNEMGAYGNAVPLINRIRQRARNSVNIAGALPPAGTLSDRPASTDKAQIKAWLVQERGVELGFECQRFPDLKRWKTAKTVLTGLGKNFQDRNYLYPIPQGEVDRSGGTIMQNTDY
jgi:hypothetical protein